MLADKETNIKGPFLMTQYYIKQFGAEGTIINVTTPGAAAVFPGMWSYSSSKLAALKAAEYVDMGQYHFSSSLDVHDDLQERSKDRSIAHERVV